MERLLCMALGYVCGLFQTAYIYGKIKGIDIRKQGSGNAGATNTLRVLGVKAALIVFAGDVCKTVVACLITRFFIAPMYPDMTYLLIMYAAAGAILGHDFPFYLGFKGGKGIASTAGLIFCFHWTLIPVAVVLFFAPFLTTHYVSLGSLMVYAGFLIQIIIEGQMGVFGMNMYARIEMYILAALLTAIAYYRHRENIKRLLKGEERKTYLTSKKA